MIPGRTQKDLRLTSEISDLNSEGKKVNAKANAKANSEPTAGLAQHQFVALIPAGGRGERMGSALAKQYLPLGGQPMIAWSVQALLSVPWIQHVYVVVAPSDDYWQQDPSLRKLGTQNPGRLTWYRAGGSSRQQTVANGLEHISRSYAASTWVMVHDAARPGISRELLEALSEAIEAGADGALLATRVADTVKRQQPDDASAGQTPTVADTIPRDGLWLAQTPQVFRLGELVLGLRQADEDGAVLTDEASVMERTGTAARLVTGDWCNVKVTTPSDLEMMQRVLGHPDADENSG